MVNTRKNATRYATMKKGMKSNTLMKLGIGSGMKSIVMKYVRNPNPMNTSDRGSSLKNRNPE
jgi:hypothetical protein